MSVLPSLAKCCQTTVVMSFPLPADRQQQAAWRQEDLVQRDLENARHLWGRYVEKNRFVANLDCHHGVLGSQGPPLSTQHAPLSCGVPGVPLAQA